MAEGPKQNGSVDTKALYDQQNRLRADLLSVQQRIANSGTAQTEPSVIQEPGVCNPFIVERRTRKRGERVTMCFVFTPGDDVQVLKAIVWRHNHQNTAYVEMFEWEFSDITDDDRAAGGYVGQFGETLPFDETFTLVRIVVTDEGGVHTRVPADNPATRNPPPFGYGITTFTTGTAGLDGPAPHNWGRNGQLTRSKYAWKKLTDPTPDNRQLECYAWYIGCDRNRPIVAQGHPQYDASLSWSKTGGGFFSWNSPFLGISQRCPHRIVNPGDLVHWLMWITKNLDLNGIIADLSVSLVSVIDTRWNSGFLSLNRIGTSTIQGLGGLATINRAGDDDGSDGVDDVDGALSRPPDDPGPPSDPVEINLYKPVQRSIQVVSTYDPSSTPIPVEGRVPKDSSGLWWLAELANIQGPAKFLTRRIRYGFGAGDWTPHPLELSTGDGDDDSTDMIGAPDVLGSQVGPGTSYAVDDVSHRPGKGGILRPFTD